MGKKKKVSLEWDENNQVDWWDWGYETEELWDEDSVTAFKLWPTEGEFTALIDADMIPYIVGFCQSEDDWFHVVRDAGDREGDDRFEFMLRHENAKKAIAHADSTLNQWVEGAQADSAKLYLTAGTEQFRYDVAFSKLYKGSPARLKAKKPPFFPLIKWYLEKVHGAIVSTEEEADDLMATEQWQHNQELVMDGAEQGSKESRRFSKTIIVTKDKDLRMIPGWHSNPDIEKGEPFWVSKRGELYPVYRNGKLHELKGSGLAFFYAQLIMGDKVDNYGGIPLAGPAKAYQVLNELGTGKEMQKAVEGLYLSKYGDKPFQFKTWTGKVIEVTWKDMMVEQGRLAWMQQSKGQMWMPKHQLPDPKLWRTDI